MTTIMNEALLKELQNYEGKWVALFDREGEMRIVAAGDDAAAASENAQKLGYSDTTLFKVIPSDVAYVPLA